MLPADRQTLSQTLGHPVWRDPALLDAALLHRSAAVERGLGDWAESQRLEFLGDAILDLLAADALFRRLPSAREGHLTALRSRITCTSAFAAVARRLGLGPLLVLGVGEEKCGGRTRESLLADTLEAVFGAIWLDGGWPAVRHSFDAVFAGDLDALLAAPPDVSANPKGALQEWAQARALPAPAYAVVSEDGPPHARRYTVRVAVASRSATATAPSKHAAEESAARAFFAALAETAPAAVPPRAGG